MLHLGSLNLRLSLFDVVIFSSAAVFRSAVRHGTIIRCICLVYFLTLCDRRTILVSRYKFDLFSFRCSFVCLCDAEVVKTRFNAREVLRALENVK